MRIAFGLLSLAVVLAIVGMIAKRAWHALPTAPAAGASTAPKPHDMTRKVAEDVGQLMQRAASRTEGDDR